MWNYYHTLYHGVLLSLVASLWLILSLKVSPRIFLQDYPPAIQERVPQKNKSERLLSFIFGIPFLLLLLGVPFISTLLLTAHGIKPPFWILWLNAAGVGWVFNVFDWLVLDWFLFCTLTPHFLVIPGSEGMAEYKDYRFHFRGFLIGSVISVLGGLVIAIIVALL